MELNNTGVAPPLMEENGICVAELRGVQTGVPVIPDVELHVVTSLGTHSDSTVTSPWASHDIVAESHRAPFANEYISAYVPALFNDCDTPKVMLSSRLGVAPTLIIDWSRVLSKG